MSAAPDFRYRFAASDCGGLALDLAGVDVLCRPAGSLWIPDARTLVVADLHFTRRTLSATLLYHPLAEGWLRPGARPAPGDRQVPPIVLVHRAVLSDEGGVPFSLVTENYTAGTIAEPGAEPAPPRR